MSLLAQYSENIRNYHLFDSISSLDVIKLFEEACLEHIKALNQDIKENYGNIQYFEILNDQIIFLKEEILVWDLVYAIVENRIRKKIDITPNYSKLSPQEIIRCNYKVNEKFREATIVLKWIENYFYENIFDQLNPIELQTYVYMDETITRASSTKDNEIFNLLDPDASKRLNKFLAPLDIEYETRLLQSVFLCIKCGQFFKAKELCVQYGQGWRGDTLDGWILYHDGPMKGKENNNFNDYNQEISIDNLERDDLILDELLMYDNKAKSRKEECGNINRIIWKNVCWKMYYDSLISDPTSKVPHNPYEIAIYASLSGNVQGILPVLDRSNWYDLLWAYTKTLIDIKIETILKTHPTIYNDRVNFSNAEDPMATQLPDEYWQQPINYEDIFEILDPLIRPASQTSLQETELPPSAVFKTVIKLIVLDDFEGLLKFIRQQSELLTQHTNFTETDINNDAAEIMGDPLKPLQRASLRFLTHLAVIIVPCYMDHILASDTRERDRLIPAIEPLCISILDNYVKSFMIPFQYLQLFLEYLKFLPEIYQKNRFSRYLEEHSSIAQDSKILVLERAKMEGIDLGPFLYGFLQDAIYEILATKGKQTSFLTHGNTLDWFLIAYNNNEYGLERFKIFSLVFANTILRKLLISDDIDEAEAILAKLRSEFMDPMLDYYIDLYKNYVKVPAEVDANNTDLIPVVIKNTIDETFAYKLYIESIKTFDLWLEHYQKAEILMAHYESGSSDPAKPSVLTSQTPQFTKEYRKWFQDFTLKTENTAEKLYSILNFPKIRGWLTDDPQIESITWTNEDLIVLRLKDQIEKLLELDRRRSPELNELRALLLPRIVSLITQVLKTGQTLNESSSTGDKPTLSTSGEKGDNALDNSDQPSTSNMAAGPAGDLNIVVETEPKDNEAVNYGEKLKQVAEIIVAKGPIMSCDELEDITHRILEENDLLPYLQ